MREARSAGASPKTRTVNAERKNANPATGQSIEMSADRGRLPGATPRNILNLVVRQGMALAVAGVTIGLLAAFLLTRLIQSLLFGVNASDPITFAGISVLLAIITLLACYIPARRAARIDPLVSLRYD